jgi:hypothetical protein
MMSQVKVKQNVEFKNRIKPVMEEKNDSTFMWYGTDAHGLSMVET